MKNQHIIVITLIICFLFLTRNVAAEVQLKVQNSFGFTAVDITQTRYSSGTMVDWDKFHYQGLIQLMIKPRRIVSFGGEVGFNRLYYWEQRYYNSSGDNRWRWGQAWTIDYGPVIHVNLGKYFYTMTGFLIHTYFNGYGTHVGFPFGVGACFPITKHFGISTDIRNDLISGRGAPFAIAGGVGLNFFFNKNE